MSYPRDFVDAVLMLADPSQPERIALETEQQVVTTRQLADWMLRAGASLRTEAGPVAIRSDDPIEHAVGVLGALAAGRPALLIDPRHPDSIADDVVVRGSATTSVGRDVGGLDGSSLKQLLSAAALPPVPTSPEEIGTILLTSGSSGPPKLVLRTRDSDLHAALTVRLAEFPISPGDRHWLTVPYAQAPFLNLGMGTLLTGATLVFGQYVPSEADAFLERNRISSVYLVPTMLRLANRATGLGGPGWMGLRALMTGGERLDIATRDLLLEHFAGRVYIGYGTTEVPRPTEASPEDIATRPGSIGRAIPLRQVAIAAEDGSGLLPVGETGEILLRGPDMMRGYLGHEPLGKWYPSGDVGHMDAEGYVYITGRASNLVNVGGNRVSLDEVAEVLRKHPELDQAAVVAVDDPMWTHRLVAFAVARIGAAVTQDELRTFAAESLPSYKMPREVRFLEELPSDSSGKLALRRLQALAEAPP
jgi:acyl-coenzyme A synthetase/AMP-(fatty) acid ligase